MEKREPFYTVGGNVNWYSHYGEQYGDSLRTKNRAPHDPAIPLLDIYLEYITIHKNTCTPVFVAALFTISKTQKQLKCSLTDEWIRKLWYIYTMSIIQP